MRVPVSGNNVRYRGEVPGYVRAGMHAPFPFLFTVRLRFSLAVVWSQSAFSELPCPRTYFEAMFCCILTLGYGTDQVEVRNLANTAASSTEGQYGCETRLCVSRPDT